MDTQFQLQHLEQIAVFSEALVLPSRLQALYHVNCVPDRPGDGRIHCGRVLRQASDQERLSDVQQLSITGMRKCTVHNDRETKFLKHPASGVVLKLQRYNPSRLEHRFSVGVIGLVTGIREERQLTVEHVIVWTRPTIDS